jgi:hypothetical protein
VSYERPLYLWATLDSLYRNTRSPVRFVLVDSGSQDPLVHQVIEGFVRRGLLAEVHKHSENNTSWAASFFEERRERLGEVFFYLDADVVVLDSSACWVERFTRLMNEQPDLAMVGSRIDKSDFEDQEGIEQRIGRKLSTGEKQQIKLFSPERKQAEIGPWELLETNPAGRLLALRTGPVHEHLGNVMNHTDAEMHRILKGHGWRTGIFGGVVHRHLSLCNLFDYPEYAMHERDKYFWPQPRS